MARFLMLPMTEGFGLGPVSQLMAVGELLQATGHECAFVANSQQSDTLCSVGFRVYGAPRPMAPNNRAPDFRLSDAADFLGISDVDYFAQALEVESDAVRSFRPDVLLSATKLSAVLTARKYDLPIASVAATPDSPWFTSPLYDCESFPEPSHQELRSLSTQLGVEIERSISELSFYHSDLWVAPTCASLDPLSDDSRRRYVGGLISSRLSRLFASAVHQVAFDVVIYVQKSSVLSGGYFDQVARLAVLLTPLEVLLVDPRPAPDGFVPPANLTHVHFAPMNEVVSSARLLVSGGGYNAMLLALSYDVPILGVTGPSAERDYNLRQVVAAGAGLVVDEFGIVDGVVRALASSEIRVGAALVGQELRLLSGPSGVVDMMLDML